MTAATAHATNELISLIPLDRLDESPTNTRRTWGNLEELAESIKEVGILQPVVARPKGSRFELVFGHRRYRAAKLAGSKDAPVIVRPLDDGQALEAQAIENLQRTDLHPLEEAEGFEQLHKRGWSAEQMASKIGKSRGYVFAAMKLLALAPELRKAFYEGAFDKSVALYLARIATPKRQLEAFKEISRKDWQGQAMTAHQAFDLIKRRFMLQLAQAPFDRGDATLVPKAGTCKDCPKRTGNQAELFADVKSKDVCTDPDCFEAKTKAHGTRLLKEAAAAGAKILEGKAAVAALGGAKAYQNGTYVLPTEEVDYHGKKFSTLAKGSGIKPVVAVGTNGMPVELLPRKAVLEHAKKEGLLKKDSPGHAGSTYREEQRKRNALVAGKRAATFAVANAVFAKAAKAEPKTGFWLMLANTLAAHTGHDTAVNILKRRAGDDEKKAKSANARAPGGAYADTTKKLRAIAEELSGNEPELRAFVVELAIAEGTYQFFGYGSPELGKGLLAAAEYYGVDAAAIAREARKELAEKKRAKKSGKAKKSKA